MPETKPIKTDLFRFATLRMPRQISEAERNTNFVFHPDWNDGAPLSSSHFYATVTTGMDLDSARMAVEGELGSFYGSAFTSYLEVKNINSDLFNLAGWLSQNAVHLDATTVASRISGISALTTGAGGQELEIWDNLFFQCLTRESAKIREACIQMLIANNFLKEATDPNLTTNAEAGIEVPAHHEALTTAEKVDLYLKKIANAKVVVPREFTRAKQPVVSQGNAAGPGNKHLVDFHQGSIAERDMGAVVSVLDELKDYHESYQVERDDALYQAQEAHLEAMIAVKIANSGDYDPQNPTPLTPLPELNFTFPEPFDPNYGNYSNLSPNAVTLLNKYGLQNGGTAAAISFLEEKVDEKSRQMISEVTADDEVVFFDGDFLNKDTEQKYSFSLGLYADELGDPAASELILSLDAGYENAFLTFADYTFDFQGNNHVGSSLVELSSRDGYIQMRLFPSQTFDASAVESFNFNMTCNLSNGVMLQIHCVGQTNASWLGEAEEVSGGANAGSGPLYGVKNLGVIDFRKVEQEVCCYVPGEVSHIENVMAKEYKERHTRILDRTETTISTEFSEESESKSDTSTTERHEMQNEVQKVLEKKKETKYGAKASVNGELFGGKLKYSVSGYADFASTNSSKRTDKAAVTLAKEVTEEALERVMVKTSEKRTSKMIREFEENNRHGFDNRSGESHVTGVYRWVDRIMVNRLVNYGKRMTLELMIPEPSKFFKQALKNQATQHPSLEILKKPSSPRRLGLTNSDQLHKNNYLKYAIAYGIQLDPPPRKYNDVEVAISRDYSAEGESIYINVDSQKVVIPEGYHAYKYEANWEGHFFASNSYRAWLNVNVGRVQQGEENSWIYGKLNHTEGLDELEKRSIHRGRFKGSLVPGIVNDLLVSISCNRFYTLNVTALIRCKINSDVYRNWQQSTFQRIWDAYRARHAEYEDARMELAARKNADLDVEDYGGQNRSIEKRELIRAGVDMLTRPFGLEIGRDFYRNVGIRCRERELKSIPAVDQSAEYETYANMVKFFEEGLDWEAMAYSFYPYYWSGKCGWEDMIRLENVKDPIFQAFLQSGMARVLVPVTEGFEDAVAYYLETGDIFSAGDLVIHTDDEFYLSAISDINATDGVVEEVWESRIPSSLTVIQASSVGLDESGLPCCNHLETEVTTNLLGSTNTLQPQVETTA